MNGRIYRAPTTTTTPVADTTAGLFTFAKGVHGLFLKNTSTKTIGIAFNGTTASAAVYDYELATNGSLHLTAADLGVGIIDSVSIWFPSGATVANLLMRGA